MNTVHGLEGVAQIHVLFSVSLNFSCFQINVGAGEMAQQLKVLFTLAEDPALVSSTHMAAHTCL